MKRHRRSSCAFHIQRAIDCCCPGRSDLDRCAGTIDRKAGTLIDCEGTCCIIIADCNGLGCRRTCRIINSYCTLYLNASCTIDRDRAGQAARLQVDRLLPRYRKGRETIQRIIHRLIRDLIRIRIGNRRSIRILYQIYILIIANTANRQTARTIDLAIT